MAKALRYEIEYSEQAESDISSLRKYDQQKIINAIERHLQLDPTKTSKSRIKRMAQPFWCQYRLRVDDFRVYYDVDSSRHVVQIVCVHDKGSDSTRVKP
jgi:mRNA-degrading endonuclease RelE of RelBE toxin-antitoxin system